MRHGRFLTSTLQTMKHRITPLFLSLTGLLTAWAAPAGDWKVYPTFDSNVLKVVDTPSKTYFQVLGQNVKTSGISDPFRTPYPFLFVYDKEADELEGLTKRNMLSDIQPSFISYNADRKYLLVGYSNGNIDLLYDDGKRVNIPALASMTFTLGKEINSVSFDAGASKAYVALPFGFIVLDDRKGEVAESCIFNSNVAAICRAGDYIVISDGKTLKAKPASDKIPTPESFKSVSGLENVTDLQTLADGSFLAISSGRLCTARIADGSLSGLRDITPSGTSGFTTLTPNRDGYLAVSDRDIAQISLNGVSQGSIAAKSSERGVPGSWDFSEIWFAKDREGLSSSRYDGSQWTLTRDFMLPNAPGVFRSTDLTYHPRYGMMAIDHGYHTALQGRDNETPSHLSILQNGEWERYGHVYTKPEWSKAHINPLGLAIDPDDARYVYSGSYYSGLVRYNLGDPADFVRFTTPGDKNPTQGSKLVNILPLNPNMESYALAAYPSFDTQGNLWIGTGHTWTTGARAQENLMVWPAEARKRGDLEGWVGINTPDWAPNWGIIPQALTHSSNAGLIVAENGRYGQPFIIYDYKRTAADTSDDRYVLLSTIYDTDGSSVSHNHIYKFWEDPATGLVWTLTDTGLFTFSPTKMFADNARVSRIKVSRNDGTNLADYLLDGVAVFDIATDSSGKKYFATGGGGLVVTSADGREILGQYTSANSYLPSDVLYSVEYNPSSRSLLISTAEGICEFFPSGSSSSAQQGDDSSLRIYPNPVRPDYYGWINIEGVPDDSLVKIVDAAGNLVKELGVVSGGTAQWDATNMDLKRVRSGVYHVFASPASGSGDVRKGKILIVN